MKLLLDTHIFLWYISADPQLPAVYKQAIRDSRNAVYLSSASLWECIIKFDLGKLPLPMPPVEYLPPRRAAHGIASLSIDEGALTALAGLPLLHRDPFDRIIVSQAQFHGMTILTSDAAVKAYPVAVMPAS